MTVDAQSDMQTIPTIAEIPDQRSGAWQGVILGFCFVWALSLSIGFLLIASVGAQSRAWVRLTLEHPASIIGLPSAAIGALFVVLVLRTVSGQITIVIPGGFSFKGASGPILMWILCFLVITMGIGMTWRSTSTIVVVPCKTQQK